MLVDLRRIFLAGLCLVAVVVLLETRPCAAAEAKFIGRSIESFSLPDFYGQTRSLADFKDNGLVVVAFLGTECPLARLYAPRLQQLYEEYSPRGVAFVGVDANDQDSLTEMAAFARRNEIAFPLLKDRDQAVADAFGAERNPMVFVLDGERKIRYHGRIDDQYGLGSSSGYARPEIKRRDLGEALDELLAGGEVSIAATPVTGCFIGRRPEGEANGEITYTKNIAAILENRCVSCHREGEIGPFALNNYDDVAAWSEMIREVVSEGRMPPWNANPDVGHFANDPRLSDDEKRLLFFWIGGGCPEGDLADLPEPREWVEGWQIDEPDQVVKMPKPYRVKAEGVLPYRYVVIDPEWTEDKWIEQAEARPDNRAVVHHILAFIIPPSGDWQKPPGEGGPSPLTSFVPGSPPVDYGHGTALYAPAGSKIMFEIHYTPNGVEQEDQSYVGLVFADPAEVKRRGYYEAAENREFEIPAHAEDHELESRYEFTEDRLLLAMAPHMHLRGKAMRFEAHYPDGTIETLLDVPRYDFNWQLRYDLAEPKRMPAGTTLVCKGRFDNSENNLANPDPSATLNFGWQTWDEMMTGFFLAVSAEEADVVAAAESTPASRE